MKQDIEILKNKIDFLNSEVNQLQGQQIQIQGRLDNYLKLIEENKAKVLLYSKCIEILDLIQKSVSNKIKEGFENIVNYAIKSIMGDIDNVFSIDFGRHGNLSELDFNIEPNDTDSGGYADIVSLALRIAVIELYKPKINGMLIFDEPFKCISKEYIQSASQFLTSIVKK
jgi:DNA repair exonuclease SbcCD ATPase subunit